MSDLVFVAPLYILFRALISRSRIKYVIHIDMHMYMCLYMYM